MVSNIFYFHPYLGKIPILTNIFQMGWNHQLDWIWHIFFGIFIPFKMREISPHFWTARPEGNWCGGSLRLPSLALPGLLRLLGLNQKKGGQKLQQTFQRAGLRRQTLRTGDSGIFFCRQERHAIGMRSKEGKMFETRTMDISKCRNLDMLTGTGAWCTVAILSQWILCSYTLACASRVMETAPQKEIGMSSQQDAQNADKTGGNPMAGLESLQTKELVPPSQDAEVSSDTSWDHVQGGADVSRQPSYKNYHLAVFVAILSVIVSVAATRVTSPSFCVLTGHLSMTGAFSRSRFECALDSCLAQFNGEVVNVSGKDIYIETWHSRGFPAMDCPGDLSQETWLKGLPRNCLGQWTELSPCPVSCGGGLRSSTFQVFHAAENGGVCEENGTLQWALPGGLWVGGLDARCEWLQQTLRQRHPQGKPCSQESCPTWWQLSGAIFSAERAKDFVQCRSMSCRFGGGSPRALWWPLGAVWRAFKMH